MKIMDKFTRKTATSIVREEVVLTTYEYADVLRERDMLVERKEHEITMLDIQIKEKNGLLEQCRKLGIK